MLLPAIRRQNAPRGAHPQVREWVSHVLPPPLTSYHADETGLQQLLVPGLYGLYRAGITLVRARAKTPPGLENPHADLHREHIEHRVTPARWLNIRCICIFRRSTTINGTPWRDLKAISGSIALTLRCRWISLAVRAPVRSTALAELHSARLAVTTPRSGALAR